LARLHPIIGWAVPLILPPPFVSCQPPLWTSPTRFVEAFSPLLFPPSRILLISPRIDNWQCKVSRICKLKTSFLLGILRKKIEKTPFFPLAFPSSIPFNLPLGYAILLLCNMPTSPARRIASVHRLSFFLFSPPSLIPPVPHCRTCERTDGHTALAVFPLSPRTSPLS